MNRSYAKCRSLVAILLAVLMVFAFLPVFASAEEPSLEGLAAEYYAGELEGDDARVAQAAIDVLSGRKVTYTNAAQLARLVKLGYSYNQADGPISITKAQLTYDTWSWFHWKTTTVDCYVVCLSGTDVDAEGQTTDWWTDFLSGFEFDNDYNKNARSVIYSTIPRGANIIFAGHSLGGMIAQQLASDSGIKSAYNVLNTVTFGSPLINGLKREGMVKRLGDTVDPVPYLSLSTFLNIVWQAAGLQREDGGYGVNIITAHKESYTRTDVWGDYDPCGEKNGSRRLTLDFSTTTFYHSDY